MSHSYKYSLNAIKLDEQGKKVSCVVKENGKLYEYSVEYILNLINTGLKIKNALVHNDELFLIPSDVKFRDLTNCTFGDWTVKEYLGNKYWKCQCKCGKIRAVYTQSLLKGTSTSCSHHSHNFKDLTDMTFSDWHVVRRDPDTKKWLCECSCSPGILHAIDTSSLLTGHSKSCGHETNAFIDLSGQTIGEWHVDSYDKQTGKWNCTCSCNNKRQISSIALRSGKSKSCGHANIRHIINKNDTFGKLTVIGYIGQSTFVCLCECGNETEVYRSNLLSGQTTSCGHCGRPARSTNLTNIIRNKDLFTSAINKVNASLKDKLTLKELSELFDISMSYAVYLVNKYDLRDSIRYLNGQSYAELELIDFCKQHGFNVVQKDRTVLENKELDIYIPSEKFAIEYNGTYHHSSEFKSYTYYQEKTLDCTNKGIRLLHIFDYEWTDINKKQKLLDLIEQTLNINQTVIYARNTEVRTVPNIEMTEFLNLYHLQNTVNCSTALGLYYDGKLIEIMTFGKPRFNSEYDTEILRLCTKAGYKVIGGASKLFKHYIKNHSTETIISYCDLAKFSGKVYEQLGMTKDTVTSPGYIYVNKSNLAVLSRQSCMKHKLIERNWGTENQTEEEIMSNHNYVRIYDSGNARYIYKPNNLKGNIGHGH